MENINQIKLSLPAELHQQLKDKAAKNQKNVEEFLISIIKREIENHRDTSAHHEEDEEKVKERLRSLGYLD